MSEQRPDYLVEAMELEGIDLDAPKQIIQEVSGFTPMFDCVVEVYQDETRAAVHGAVWRFCQMEDGVCKASLETISKLLGISKATVMRHIEALCNDGYFFDLTPDLRNRPHVYRDSGKVVMKSRLSAGVSQRNAGVSERNATVSQRNAGVSESQLNKDIKKDSKKESIKGGARAHRQPKPEKPAEVSLYRTVTKKFPPEANTEQVTQLIRAVSNRLGKDATAEDLRPYYQAWTANGWNQFSINWLEYAVKGELPRPQFKQQVKQAAARFIDPVTQFLNSHQEEIING